MRTNVYVDGFNLYYGALKGTPYRWLDLAALCRRILPRDIIHRIRYFTARVTARPDDPEQPIRQQVYLRALTSFPNVTVHYGHFLTHRHRMALAPAPPAPARMAPAAEFVWVWKTEEKGSDVNLATHLLHDAYRDDYELAVVISNDSDLVEPIRIVRHELGKPVGVFTPFRQHPSQELKKHAKFFKELRRSALAASQLPAILGDAHGTFQKPSGW